MRKHLYLLLGLLLMAACSGDGTGPGGGGTEPESFSVSYAVESGNSASEPVSALSGGTVEATGSNGVIYRLLIPAGALPGDTTITITPVSDLAVTGPGAFLCAASCGSEDCCVTGALFEPEGLEFDSLVTLEIEFPAAEPFPFDSVGSIFLFDSPRSVIGACESEIDFAAGRLTARIWHFSGYGTGAAECERLLNLYESSKAFALAYAGLDRFFYELYSLIQIISSNRSCDPYGIEGCRELCEGLDTQVLIAARDALGSHRVALLALHPASPATIHDIEQLIEELGRLRYVSGVASLSSEVQLFRAAVLARILEMAQTIAVEARTLCGDSEQCGEGMRLLWMILEFGRQGYITDSAFLADVQTWHDDCCLGWKLSISVDRSEILRAVINPGDEDMCIATITLKLTTSSGEPIEGVYVDCGWDANAINLGGGDTDEAGEHKIKVSAYDLGYGDRFNFAENVQKTVNSKVYNSEMDEWTEAAPIVLTFRNFSVTMTIDYTYTAVEDKDEDNFGDIAASITGEGTNYANTIYLATTTCGGVVTRAYLSTGCVAGACGETTVKDGAEVPGCCLLPVLESYRHPSEDVMLYMLAGLRFFLSNLTANVLFEGCVDGECSEYTADIRSQVKWPGYGVIPDYFENTTGAFEQVLWEYSESSDTGEKQANLTITVEASH